MPTSKFISLGQILDLTWEIYVKNFKTFMRISAWLFLITFLTIIGIILAPTGDTAFLIEQKLITIPQWIGIYLSALAPTIGAAIVSIWVFLNLILWTDTLSKNKKGTYAELNKRAWKKFLPYIGVIVLRGAIFLLPLLVVLPGIVLIVASIQMDAGALLSSFSILLTFIGTLAALALVIVFWVWFAFPGYELMLANQGVIASLKGSRQLVKGKFFGTFVRLLIPKVIFTLFIVVAQIAIFALFMFLFTSLPNIGQDAYERLAEIAGHLVLATISVLTVPFFVIADYLIYDSLKSLKK